MTGRALLITGTSTDVGKTIVTHDAAKFDPGTVTADGLTCRFNPWPYPIA